mgnify:CR=1
MLAGLITNYPSKVSESPDYVG